MKSIYKLKYLMILSALWLMGIIQILDMSLRDNREEFGQSFRRIQKNIFDNDLFHGNENDARRNWAYEAGSKYNRSIQKNEQRYEQKNSTDVYFSDYFSINEQPLSTWIKESNGKHICDKITVFAGRYAIGHDILMFPERRRFGANQPKGGEQIKDVLQQQEYKEIYNFNADFWEVICDTKIENKNFGQFFWSKSIKLISAINNKEVPVMLKGMRNETKYTIGVRRRDYANLHNWVQNIYNTFLTMIHVKIRPSDVSILFLDGHPFTYLDNAWATILSEPIRVGHLTEPILYKNFVWGFQENMGPINEQKENETVPYLEEFREFVLSRYNLSHRKVLNCKQIQITIILRRNAVYHPRNVEGNVGRKIFNEAEIVDALIDAVPSANVFPVLMESLPMKKQLEIASNTDIWIGMHGAGMSHVAFLPKHAAVIELFPLGFKTNRPWYICFHSLTVWRGMEYDTWENFDPALEMPNDFTIVPVDIVANKTLSHVQEICPNM